MNRFKYLIYLFILILIPSFLGASSYRRIEHPKFQAFDSSGDPCSGCLLYTYEPGTTTAKATYDADDSANTNPVVLGSDGRAEVYGTGYYKLVLKTSAGTTIWTIDNIQGIGETSRTDIGDYNADFDAAITAISSTATTLYVNEAATMSTAVTVPATCTVVLEKGGSIDQSGSALTFNGPLIAHGGTITNDAATTVAHSLIGGAYNIFTSTGTVTVTADQVVLADWFTTIDKAVGSGAKHLLLSSGTTYATDGALAPATDALVEGSRSSVVQLSAGSDADIFTLSNAGVTLRGFKIDGNKANQTGTSHGVKITAANCKVKDLYIQNAYSEGIYVYGVSDALITGNYIEDSGSNCILAEAVSADINSIIVTGNTADRASIGASTTEGGIKFHGDNDSYYVVGGSISNNLVKLANNVGVSGHVGIEVWGLTKHVSITGNTVDGGSIGISADQSNYTTITGNTVRNDANIGIELASSSYSVISGNTLYNLTDYGISVSGTDADSTDNIIIGNTIRDAGGMSIQLYDVSHRAVISGNNVYSGANRGIYVNGGAGTVIQDVSIVGNVVSGCTKSGIYANATMDIIISGNITVLNNTGNTAGEGGIIQNASYGVRFSNNISHQNKQSDIYSPYADSPTSGHWHIGERVYESAPAGGAAPGWVCIKNILTEVKSTISATDTQVDVDDTTGMAGSDIIGFELDDGSWHWTTISSVDDGDTITVNDAFPSGAAVDNDVVDNLWKDMANLGA